MSPTRRRARRSRSTRRCSAARWARACSTRSASSAACATRSGPPTTPTPTSRRCSSARASTRPSASRRTPACARSSPSCTPTARPPRRSSAPARTPPAGACSRSRTRTPSRGTPRTRRSCSARASTPTRRTRASTASGPTRSPPRRARWTRTRSPSRASGRTRRPSSDSPRIRAVNRLHAGARLRENGRRDRCRRPRQPARARPLRPARERPLAAPARAARRSPRRRRPRARATARARPRVRRRPRLGVLRRRPLAPARLPGGQPVGRLRDGRPGRRALLHAGRVRAQGRGARGGPRRRRVRHRAVGVRRRFDATRDVGALPLSQGSVAAMTPLLSSALLRAQTDERLVELAAAGHDRAFEAIVERYRRPLLRYLRRLLSDTLAEDVVQATFINAWSSLRTGTDVRDLRPWLYRIAHNAAINSLKKVGEAMEEVPESAGGFATEPAAELERRDEVQRALTSIAALPSRQRAALLAVAVDGRAHADVAQELGLTDGAVRQLVHRARITLRTGVTAVTPLPLLNMLMTSAGDSTVGRVAEVAAGAGGAGAASLSLKAGAAAVIATGALVTGAPKVVHVVHPSARAPHAAAQSARRAAPAAAAAAGAATPASVVTTPAGTSGGSSHRAPAASPTSGSSHRHSSGTSQRRRRRGR